MAVSVAVSAFAVAGPGADHAILAAVLVAVLQSDILRLAQSCCDRIADARRRRCGRRWRWRRRRGAPATTLQPPEHLASAARACGRFLSEVVGKAIGAAGPDGERAGRLGRVDRKNEQARRGNYAASSPSKRRHENPSPRRNPKMLPNRRFQLVNGTTTPRAPNRLKLVRPCSP